jgi:hypothetical protein
MTSMDKSSLWANRKCLLICSAVAIASMQYGIDTAAVGGLQAMPGFLMVFGYRDPASPLGYGIDASHSIGDRSWSIGLTMQAVNSPTAHDKPHEFRSVHLCHFSRHFRRISWSQTCFVASLYRGLCGCRIANRINFPSRSICWSLLPWLFERLSRGIFDRILQRSGTCTFARVNSSLIP